jgi:hypothetical protein
VTVGIFCHPKENQEYLRGATSCNFQKLEVAKLVSLVQYFFGYILAFERSTELTIDI